jgi:predicted kinase
MLNITSSLLSLLIVLFSGLPGVGKTKLANELAPLIKAVVLSTDKIRKELISNPTYTEEEKELISDVMLLVARYFHNQAGTNCILDGTFNTKESRRKAKEKLESVSPEQIYIVECICPEDIVLSRLRARKGDYSDANIDIYRKMKQVYEPVEEKERHIVADTSLNPKINAEEIKSRILGERQRNE